MIDPRILRHYARKDVQQAIVQLAKDREVAVKYGEGGFGKRPDILQYPSDVFELAKKGVTSFHVSEERWKDPLQLRSGMAKRQLDEIRIGWDLVLDLDTNFIEFAKCAAILLKDALNFYNVASIGCKFSGRSGFHLFVPFESFPEQVNDQETRLLFPDGVRNVANHLKQMIEKPLRDQILSLSTVDEMQKATGKKAEELLKQNKFDPFSVVGIDSVLISSRHMFRAVYSINEKSGLVSIPVKADAIKNFSLRQAKIENVTTDIPFVVQPATVEAKHLIIEAFDMAVKTEDRYTAPKDKNAARTQDAFEIPKVKVKDELFPECIQKTLRGMDSDGRKRAVFVLINFFRHMGYNHDEIFERLLEWNKKNYEPLREGYIKTQVTWHKRQQENILPPNCDNQAYYPIIGTCNNNHCHFRNPVYYVRKRLQAQRPQKEKAPKKQRKSKKSVQDVSKAS
ncbi:MAG: DNA primase small subunit domain-containing protein [Nanoarchaeota archaeon]